MLVPLTDANQPYAAMMLAVIYDFEASARKRRDATRPGAGAPRRSFFPRPRRTWTRLGTTETSAVDSPAPL